VTSWCKFGKKYFVNEANEIENEPIGRTMRDLKLSVELHLVSGSLQN